MKKFCFTVDDNIRCLDELTRSECKSIFEHPYLNMYKRLHEKYNLKIQMNLFYENDNFNLSQMTDRFSEEWRSVSDWLKLSFHSKKENVRPYEFSGYDEVFNDCRDVHREILRFASPESLAKTTTVHYCFATKEGLEALKDNGVKGLLGLYGNGAVSYERSDEECERIRKGEVVLSDGISHAAIDMCFNSYRKEQVEPTLSEFLDRDFVKIMTHEQYFYTDYRRYQPYFEESLEIAFDLLTENGFTSIFFEEYNKA